MKATTLLLPAVLMLLSGTAFAQSRANASHVDFDDQLINGQVNKGAVHLIERRDADLGTLVHTRKSYRKEILAENETVAVKPVAASPLMAMTGSVLPVVKAIDVGPAPVVAKPASTPMQVASADPAPAAKKAAPAPAAKSSAKSPKSSSKSGGSRARR